MSAALLDDARVLVVGAAGEPGGRLRAPLDAAGVDVRAVDAAGECLDRIEDDDVDGVVSEYRLPDLDGVRLLRSIRLSHPDLPFVLAPADGTESIAADALAAGATGYVPDAADPESVVTRLRDGVRRANRAGDNDGRYRHVIEQSPAPINVFDESGESVWCNEAAVDLLDLDGRADLMGESIFQFVHPDDHDLAREELGRVVDAKESTGPTRMRLRTAEGDVRHVHVTTAIGSFRGTDIGQAVVLDVTERRERERQLKALDQWLRHNIRNEVTVIHGYAECIEGGAVDDATEAAGRIREHAAHLAAQADRERELLSLLSNPPSPVETDVSATVRRVVGTVREDEPAATVETAVAPDVTAMAVPELETAVAELVENAVDHAESAEPTLSVEVTADDDGGARIRVADDGPGIPDRERHVLLADREITQLDHGTGLGILYVYWVVRLSGGEVTVSENDPAGTVVAITLPPVDAR